MKITVARTAGEVDVLRNVWNRFDREAVNADIDYHLMLVERSPEAVRPHVLLVEGDGDAAALVIGRIEDVRLPLKVGYATALQPRLRALTISYGGVLGTSDSEMSDAVITQALATLARREADVARFRGLRVDSALHRTARARPGLLARDVLGVQSPRWRARLGESYEDYLTRRSGKTRANMRRYGRRFEEAFPDAIEFRLFREPTDLDRLLEDSSVVYARTYQHGLGVGFSDSGIEREVTTFALARGWFRGFVLYVEGRPSAFWHGIRYGRVFTTGATGYDPAFRDHRIGTYVLGRMVEELSREDGLELIDFGSGDAEYKSHFGDDRWLEEDVFVWATRARPVAVNGARTALLAADRSAKSLLRRRDLLTRARRLGRDRARRKGS